jgi:cation diffusion facilitator family transporter
VVHAPPEAKSAEKRTRWVVYLTAGMMVAELVFGYSSRSLALVADGWHMMTHVGALGLSWLAYWYARTRAGEQRFVFGTGKVYALAGYSSAGLLMAVAIGMVVSAVERLVSPVEVNFGEALPVAIVGLLVNIASVWLLDVGHDHDHAHDHDHDHDHPHEHDHNLRAAYLHVVADALTSVLAIAAIVAGKWFHVGWLDAAVAMLGGVLIVRWGLSLMAQSARQLVDLAPSETNREAVRAALEKFEGTQVADLHVWQVGPSQQVCVVAVVTTKPRTLDEYRAAALSAAKLSHLTVEIRVCP